VIVNKENGGLPSARNAGLDRASGDYIGFVDSDDYVSLTMYEKMYNCATNQKSEVVVCGGTPFPQDPVPDNWLIDVLSPRKVRYPQFDKSILFDEKGAKPFLWRMLVKRSLIEDNHIRLDEKIILGEDVGFQFKVYPLAKGISFIPDKLYYYRWFRKDSIMQANALVNIEKKVESHIALVNHLLSIMVKQNNYEKMSIEFLHWSIDFIYGDFMKLSRESKIRLSQEIYKSYESVNLWNHWIEIRPETKEMVDYILSFKNEEYKKPVISIIVTCNNSKYFIERCMSSIIKQTISDLEIICINNGTNDGTYWHLHKLIRRDHRVSLINQSKHSDMECWRYGTLAASSDLLMFINSNEYYSGDFIAEIIDSFDSDVDAFFFNMVNTVLNRNRGAYVADCKCLSMEAFKCLPSINQGVFRKNLIINCLENLGNYSVLDESVLMTHIIGKNVRIKAISIPLYYSNVAFDKQLLGRSQVISILDGCLKIIDIGNESNVQWLNYMVSNLLDSDLMVALVMQNINCCEKDKEQNALETEIWCKIIDINNKLIRKNLNNSELVLIRCYLEKEHALLDSIQRKAK
jgi:glycosyltransferase involved in cell wall biosynthesis